MKHAITLSRFTKLIVIAISLVAAPAVGAANAISSTTGYVYVMTNQPAGNSIVQYVRKSNGSLTKLQEVFTGGLGGTGNGVPPLDPLGSQDSLVLTGAGTLLLAVNAGSNQVSSMTAMGGVLKSASIVDSGGVFPNSVAVHENLVYVLNAHTHNIVGFHLDSSGVLSPITGAVFAVPGGAAAKPHDIRFAPDGTRLVVTVEGTNEIDIFALNSAGLVTGVTGQPAAGLGPFGFKFGRGGVLVSTEANSASVSTYLLNADDTLTVVSGAVPDTQAASCWISVSPEGKFGFVSNTASGTLSTYQISGAGTLNLESAVTASIVDGAPIDSALSSDGAFLYVVDSAQGHVASFRVNGASLVPLEIVTGLPTTLQGIAAQ